MILDTNAVSDLFAGEPALEARLSASERHHLPIIVIGEYRYGLMRSRARGVLEELLERLADESFILYPDRTTTVHYATIRHRLKQAGTPIPENDIWIAALAVQHELPVVTRDRHYDLVEGVTKLYW